MQPNFFIIGAPKCGTTALSRYLSQHPNIFMSDPKEPHYFCDDFKPAMRTIKTEEDYTKIFSTANSDHHAVGEASVWYLYSKVAVKNIFNFRADAKIIVMLRNPVDLVYSMHAQSLNSVDDDEPDFEKAWWLQDDRLEGVNMPKHCRDAKKLQYRDIGMLGEQLSQVLSIFPASQVKVIFFDDFTTRTEQVFKEVVEFLKVPDMAENLEFKAVNENAVDSSYLLAVFYRRTPKILVAFFMWLKRTLGIKKWGLKKWLMTWNMKTQTREKLPTGFRKELVEYFSQDVEKLALITSRDLGHWQ